MGRKKTKVDFLLYFLSILLAVSLILVERCIRKKYDTLFGKSEVDVQEDWDVELAELISKTVRGKKDAGTKGKAQKTAMKPLISCPQAQKKVKIDAYLNDEMWSRAGSVENFIVHDNEGKRLAKKKTRVNLGYDRHNLYIGFLCYGAPAKYFRAVGKPCSREKWARESFGLLIDNSEEHDSYYRFGVNLDGTVADALKKDTGWEGEWSVKTSYQNGCWVGEIAIPFSTLGVAKPEIGDSWGINFYRRYNIRRKQYLSLWHGEKDSYLKPGNFAVLSFIKDAPQLKIAGMGSSLGENSFRANIKNLSGKKAKWQFSLEVIPYKGSISTTKEEMELLGEEEKEVHLHYSIKKEGWYDLVYYLQESKSGKVLCCSTGYPVKAGMVGEPPLLTVSPVRTPIVLDGKLDEPAWSRASSFEDFVLSDREQAAKAKTTAYLAYDKENFYLGFRNDEPCMDKIEAARTERDGLVWTDDCVEFFLNPTKNLITYYHFMLNSLATQWDEFFLLKEWNADWEGKTSSGEDYWIAEIAIPFSQMGLNEIKEGAIWHINLHRRRYADIEELSSWSPTFGSIPDPERFGIIMFTRERFPTIKVISAKSPLTKHAGIPRAEALGYLPYKSSLKLEIENNSDFPRNLTVKVEIYNPQGEVETSLVPVSLREGEKKITDIHYYLSELGTSHIVFSVMDERKETCFRSVSYPVVPERQSSLNL